MMSRSATRHGACSTACSSTMRRMSCGLASARGCVCWCSSISCHSGTAIRNAPEHVRPGRYDNHRWAKAASSSAVGGGPRIPATISAFYEKIGRRIAGGDGTSTLPDDIATRRQQTPLRCSVRLISGCQDDSGLDGRILQRALHRGASQGLERRSLPRRLQEVPQDHRLMECRRTRSRTITRSGSPTRHSTRSCPSRSDARPVASREAGYRAPCETSLHGADPLLVAAGVCCVD